jgi:hypothetical protein
MPVRNLLLVVLALFLGCAASRADESIGLDEEHKGMTKGDKVRRSQKLTAGSATIDLKAGQSIELSVRVLGDDRQAAIIVWNAEGQAIASNAPPRKRAFGGGEIPLSALTKANLGDAQHLVTMSKKTAKVVMREVPGTGTYTIAVYSDVAGAYVLTTKNLSKARDVQTIEKELREAKARVEELEKELKEARRRKKPR